MRYTAKGTPRPCIWWWKPRAKTRNRIADEEGFKIDSAKKFFQTLQKEGVPVRFETKIDGENLSALISKILKTHS